MTTPCHADGQGPCVADCCPIKGRRAPAWCRPAHDDCSLNPAPVPSSSVVRPEPTTPDPEHTPRLPGV